MPPSILERVLQHVDQDLLVALTRSLIRIDSVYRPGSGTTEARVASYVANLLQEWGFTVRVEEAAPGRPNVMAELRGTSPGKTLLFEAHSDVVTEGDARSWTYPPFEGVVVDDRIYGRGACDTKGNLAAAMVALKAIKEAAIDFPGRILLAIPVDEEGLMIGIKQMIRSGWCDGVDGAIICEPEENQLCIAQKGALRIGIRAYGRMAHGAMPRSGVNPVTPLCRMVTRLAELERNECERFGEDPHVGWPSITPTIFLAPEGGEPQINVIPNQAYVTLDIRTTPAQDHEYLKETVELIARQVERDVPGLRVEVTLIDERPCTQTPPDDPVVMASAQAYRLVTGREPRYNGVPGATDGTFLWAWKGIPIVTFGAGKREIPHQVDEYVEIPELIETARIYAAAAILFLTESR